MENLFWAPEDISRLTSVSYKSSSLIIGTSALQNDIMMRTNNMNALYINDNQDVSIHTTHAQGRLNIGNADDHIVCYYNNDVNKYSTIAVDSTGSLRLSSTGDIYLDNNIYLLGQRLEASASELNYVHGVIPGIAASSKALITNSSNSVAGLLDISASTVHGTLKTASQPFITKVGTLSSLSVTNEITASQLTGVLQTQEQPNITKVGTLQTLVVNDTIFASSFSGTLQTATQPNITSVGTLTSLAVTNGITATLVSASSFMGTLLTAAQPNITSLGTLTSLSVTNGIVASQLTGVLQTASQPNITSVGTLTSLAVTNGITASQLTGVLQTASQPNITSVGTLTSLSVSNGITASQLTGVLQTASQPNITSVGTLTSLAVTNGIVASQLTGVLQTASQPNITSVGKLTNLQTFGSISTDNKVISAIPIDASSGGTGTNTYSKGDILVGNSSNALTKVPVSSTFGSILVSDSSQTSGIAWGYEFIAQTYSILGNVKTNSNTNYVIGPYKGVDSLLTTSLTIPAISTNLLTVGLNGIGVSSALSGTVYPGFTTTIAGTATNFVNQIPSLHSVIKVGNEFRRVIGITNANEIIIETPFTLLNSWTLGATGTLVDTNTKFGAGAFNGANAVTANTTVVVGSPHRNFLGFINRAPWTLEMSVRYVRPVGLPQQMSIASSTTPFTFNLAINNADRFILSTGEGTTFNIGVDRVMSGTYSQNVYYHIAIVYSGSRYVVYIDGVEVLVMNTSRAVTTSCFNSFQFGSDGTNAFNGQIDEVRLSNVVRYSSAFAAPTAAFAYDANTIFLNQFNTTTSVTTSDVATLSANRQFQYQLDGGICANTVYYCYGIASATSSGYVFSSSNVIPPLPSGFTLFRQIPFYVISNSNSAIVPSRYVGNRSSSSGMAFIQLMTPIPIVTNATNVSPTVLNTSLFPFVPQNTSSIVLLLTHNHVTATSSGIVIGHNSASLTTTLLTTATASSIQIQYTLPINQMNIDTFFTANAAGSTYSISICGFYTE